MICNLSIESVKTRKYHTTYIETMAECEQGWTGSLRDMDDEFMLYKFKVLPCTRKGAHSWTECCYTHPGEKAARRCPQTHTYTAEACPDARKSGKCARGDLCPYSHGVFEQWLHPSRFRTQLCSFGTACRRPVCFFAHTVQELRVPAAAGQGPAPGASAATGFSAASAAAAAAFGLNPAAALAGNDSYLALMQQAALLSQMSNSHVDGATATIINRYQAASCAALANAAACQRQQQQHQAAAAAAAAAAIAAAANNPASLLSMAQAAQAYQAAAVAAAAAAANVHMPQAVAGNQSMAQLGSLSSRSSSSNVSSPTCSSNTNSFPSSLSTYDPADGRFAADSSAAANSPASGMYDSFWLQQALLNTQSSAFDNGNLPNAQCPASSSLPWLPHSCSGPLVPEAALAAAAAAAASVGGGLFNSIPSVSAHMHNACSAASAMDSCGLDMLTTKISRQLSLQLQ